MCYGMGLELAFTGGLPLQTLSALPFIHYSFMGEFGCVATCILLLGSVSA